jgi:transcriptional regulator with GAF, ATPase, and Fis domain
VLLRGETGVGKTYAARAISAHSKWLTLDGSEVTRLYRNVAGQFLVTAPKLIEALSYKEIGDGKQQRSALRLATVLGTQLVDELADSQLFGHTKGAFTGADDDSHGIFGDTSVEDVLLDEIGDISPRVQAKLLHFIETRQFRKVGAPASEEQESEHRLFLATNRPLEQWVAERRFREDLYWRLQSHVITIPPLRERLDVISDLAVSILRSVNQRHRGAEERHPACDLRREHYRVLPADERIPGREEVSNWVLRFDDEDLAWCGTYDWPGNVRELVLRVEQYVFYDGHRRLGDVVPPQRAVSDPTKAIHGTPRELVTRAVELELQAVLAGDSPAFGTPSDYLDRFRQLVTSAFREVKDRNALTPAQIQRLFPDAKDPVSTISRWRR